MKIIKVQLRQKGHVIYSPSFEIKKNTANYFVRGIGWKSSKRYEVLDIDESSGHWLNYAVIARQFGDEVASYAYCGYTSVWFQMRCEALFNALEKLDFPEIPDEFIQHIQFDRVLLLCGCTLVDVVELDRRLYTPDGISTEEQIRRMYGEDAVRLIDILFTAH